jgi:hypothetical protein
MLTPSMFLCLWKAGSKKQFFELGTHQTAQILHNDTEF